MGSFQVIMSRWHDDCEAYAWLKQRVSLGMPFTHAHSPDGGPIAPLLAWACELGGMLCLFSSVFCSALPACVYRERQ